MEIRTTKIIRIVKTITSRTHDLMSPNNNKDLMSPNYNKEFIITTDACATGYGGVLSQLDDDGRERLIAYHSKRFNKQKKIWSTYEQECYALVQCLKRFRPFIEGNHIKLFTDHKFLIYLNRQPTLNAKQALLVSFLN